MTVNGVRKDTTQETTPVQHRAKNAKKEHTGSRRGPTIGGHALRAGIQKQVLQNANNVHLAHGQETKEVGPLVCTQSPLVLPSTTHNHEEWVSKSQGCRL